MEENQALDNSQETPIVEETTVESEEANAEEQAEKNDDDYADFDDTQEKPNQNQNNAKLRIQRKQEREKQRREEQERKEREAHLKGFREASGNINRFTNETLDTEEDIEAYKLMLEIEKDGGDPIEDYYKYTIKRQKAQREEQERISREQAEKDKSIDNDINEFTKKYPKESLKDLLSENSEFTELFGDMLGNAPLTTLYEKYQKIQSKVNVAKNDSKVRQEAIKMSSTGALGKNADPPKVSFSDMTSEEFREWKKKNIRI